MNFKYSAYEIVMIVHELHKQGYEHLRLFSGLSPNGCSWRWFVYPKIMMGTDNRFELHDDCTPFKCPRGSTGESYPEDGRAMMTAEQFMVDYENIIGLLSKAKDAEYVKWFHQIVEHAERRDFPIAFADGSGRWQFTSGEKLMPPPFIPATLRDLQDERVWSQLDEIKKILSL